MKVEKYEKWNIPKLFIRKIKKFKNSKSNNYIIN